MIQDAGLEDYRRLNEPRFRRQYETERGIFVAEGPMVVERIARRAPDLIRSLLVEEKRADRAPDLDLPVHIRTVEEIAAIVGFPFHRGLLAVCDRPAPVAIDDLPETGPIALLEGINDHENLGSIIRAAAALGIVSMVLDPTTADPWYRRSVRVSVGTIVDLPIVRSEDWPDDIDRLRARGRSLVASSPAGGVDVRTVGRVDRPVIALGAEGPGLSQDVLSRADLVVRIPMAAEVDSLNVGQAAAVLFDRLSGGS